MSKNHEISLSGVMFSEKHNSLEIEKLFFQWLEANEIYYGGIIKDLDDEEEEKDNSSM